LKFDHYQLIKPESSHYRDCLRPFLKARVVKLADTLCSGRSNRKVVRVQVSPRAH
jgi:hypothetical protein